MHRFVHLRCHPQLFSNADTCFPSVEHEHDHFVAMNQMMAVVPFPKRPIDRQAMFNERVTMRDGREDLVSRFDQRHRRSARIPVSLDTNRRVRMRIWRREVDHVLASLYAETGIAKVACLGSSLSHRRWQGT